MEIKCRVYTDAQRVVVGMTVFETMSADMDMYEFTSGVMCVTRAVPQGLLAKLVLPLPLLSVSLPLPLGL